MRLIDLDASLRRIADVFHGGIRHSPVETVGEADGVMFLCPKCFAAAGGPVGVHRVICWSPSAPWDAEPGPGRWALLGSSIADLTLGPIPGKTHSVQLIGGCEWHGFVENGAIRAA